MRTLLKLTGLSVVALCLLAAGYCFAVWLQWEVHYSHDHMHTQNLIIEHGEQVLQCPVIEERDVIQFNAYPAQRPQVFDLFTPKEGVPR